MAGKRIDLRRLPERFQDQLRNNEVDIDFKPMTAQEAFREWMEYEGIIGYADQIWEMVEVLKKAEVEC